MTQQQFYGFSDAMFNATKIDFHSFKNGEHKFRVLPPYAQDKLFEKVDLHWGFTDINGAKKALKCTAWTHKKCPICDEVEKIKGEIELLKNDTTSDKKYIEEQIAYKEKRMGEIKRKPTYLWNILTEEGQQKVLQLSWNGHDALWQKVSFFWKQRKINVTDLNNNYLMYCSRTGQNAKTRYQYEVLEQYIRQVTLSSPLIDLSKVYQDRTPSELKEIVDQGYANQSETDPTDKDFTAAAPTGTNTQTVGNGNVQQVTNVSANQATTPANGNQNPLSNGQNAQNNVSHSNNQTQLSNEAKQAVDNGYENLMKSLS